MRVGKNISVIIAGTGLLVLTVSYFLWKGNVNSLRGLENSREAIRCLAFSRDGKTLAAAGDDEGLVTIWDTAARKVVRSFKGAHAEIQAIDFSPNENIIAVGGNGFVRLWTLDTEKELEGLRFDEEGPLWVTAICFSPDGKILATGGGPGDNAVRLWDLATRKGKGALRGDPTYYITKVVFSSNGERLIATSYDGMIRMLDMATNTTSTIGGHLFRGYYQGALCASLTARGDKLATGSIANEIKVWNMEQLTEEGVLGGHKEPVNSVAFSPDGMILASASGQRLDRQGELKLWDVCKGREIASLSPHQGPVQCVAISPDGALLVSGGRDGLVKWFRMDEIVNGRCEPTVHR